MHIVGDLTPWGIYHTTCFLVVMVNENVLAKLWYDWFTSIPLLSHLLN